MFLGCCLLCPELGCTDRRGVAPNVMTISAVNTEADGLFMTTSYSNKLMIRA